MQRIWKVAGILAVVWLVAGSVIWFSRASRSTPESLAAFIAKNPLEGLTEARRTEVIGKVADQINRFNFDQRQELRKLGADRELFRAMTPDERKRFLDLTMPEGFRQLMIALNKMDPAKRKKLVQRALDDIERDTPEINERIDRAEVQKMISQGVGSFYEEANADVKLEFAPVIERLQRATQNLR